MPGHSNKKHTPAPVQQWVSAKRKSDPKCCLQDNEIDAIPRPYRDIAIQESAVYRVLFDREESFKSIKAALNQGYIETNPSGDIPHFTLSGHLFGDDDEVRNKIIASPLLLRQLAEAQNEKFEVALEYAEGIQALVETEGKTIGREGSTLLTQYIFYHSPNTDFILKHAKKIAPFLKKYDISLDELMHVFCEDDIAELIDADLSNAEQVDHFSGREAEVMQAWQRKRPINRCFRFPLKALMEASDEQYHWIMNHQNMFLRKIKKDGTYDRFRMQSWRDFTLAEVWPHREWFYLNRELLNRACPHQNRRDVLDAFLLPKRRVNIWIQCRHHFLWSFSAVGCSLLSVASFSSAYAVPWSNILTNPQFVSAAPIILLCLGVAFAALATFSVVQAHCKTSPIILARSVPFKPVSKKEAAKNPAVVNGNPGDDGDPEQGEALAQQP